MLKWITGAGRRAFDSLSEQEILALAISSEEEDARIYRAYADGLAESYPASAAIFTGMATEEDNHRHRLIAIYQRRFGETIPLITRAHVRGFYDRTPDWLVRPLGLGTTRAMAIRMEEEARRFYAAAAERARDAATRELLGDLASAEAGHETVARRLTTQNLPPQVAAAEDVRERRQFLLTFVQPGLAGLMDGSVSTLAPIFAAAFATGDSRQTLLVGLSASLGAGISMGFTEAAHDDGKLTGRGSPVKRGLASGIMTAIGGLGHALPFLIPSIHLAILLAVAVVFVELWAITWIQNRYMETPWFRAAVQVLIGGGLVLATGVLIGSI